MRERHAFSRGEDGKTIARDFAYVDEADARALVRTRTIELTTRPYDEIVKLVGRRFLTRIDSPKGLPYDLQTEAFWDGDAEAGWVFVALSINDAGWKAGEDFSDSFIMDRSATIIGNSGF